MRSQPAILVNGSRLMRELVKHVIEKDTGFEVVMELSDMLELPSAIMSRNAEWVFLILSTSQEIPEFLKVELFLKRPPLRLVALWMDDGQVKTEWLVHDQKDLSELSLHELTTLLQDELHTVQATDDAVKGVK